MEYLHDHYILHRDLSYNNVMISENQSFKGDLTLKLTDFGLSKNQIEDNLSNSYTHIRGTLIDPAIKVFKKFTEQNDIYSVGLVMNLIYYQRDTLEEDDTKMNKIIYKCIDPKLSNRYKNIAEIKEAIKELEVK